MSQPHDDYKKLDTPAGLEPCPCCGSDAELWQYSVSETAPTNKVVCCSMGDPIGPQNGVVWAGCPLYMPPNDFYQATAREASKFWNEFAKAITALGRANRWKRAQVLRSAAKKGEPT